MEFVERLRRVVGLADGLGNRRVVAFAPPGGFGEEAVSKFVPVPEITVVVMNLGKPLTYRKGTVMSRAQEVRADCKATFGSGIDDASMDVLVSGGLAALKKGPAELQKYCSDVVNGMPEEQLREWLAGYRKDLLAALSKEDLQRQVATLLLDVFKRPVIRRQVNVSANRMHEHSGVIHLGGPGWWENMHTGKIDKAGGSGCRLEGIYRDLRQSDPQRWSTMVAGHESDRRLLIAVEQALADNASGSTVSSMKLNMPRVYAPLEELGTGEATFRHRESSAVYQMVAKIVNERAFGRQMMTDLCTFNDSVVRFGDGKYTVQEAGGAQYTLAAPSDALRAEIQAWTGIRTPVTLHPLYTTDAQVMKGASLWSPFPQSTCKVYTVEELRVMSEWPAILGTCLLSSMFWKEGVRHIPYQYAHSHCTPVADLSAGPMFRPVQLVIPAPSALMFQAEEWLVDLHNTPVRVFLREKREAREARETAEGS